MAREGRILVDGGVYHVISRGHNRYRLFHDAGDYKAYKKIIRDYKKRFHFELFHYCLMPNHIHLLLRVSTGIELPRIMQGLNQSYSTHYKRAYKLVGNLFQGRYKSLFIDKDAYLLECGRYIERNPLRARLVSDLSEYYFSSYNFYAKGRRDDIISSNPLYDELLKDHKEQMKRYQDYLLQDRPYEHIVDRELKV
ncbi:MAG: transposase [Candidatus Omnitrophica bacterium]|nr:transposase [Candidatus Omnitrophota bacterium]